MKLSWNYLKKYHINPPTIIFPREDDVSEKYKIFKKKLNNKNLSTKDYIQNNYFKKNENFIFIKNNFPYALESNILHFVLWFHTKFTNNLSNIFPNDLNKQEVLIKKCIKESFKEFDNYEYIFFENNLNCRSILDIRHVQVFMKNKNK